MILETDLIAILCGLKENYNVIGLKISFEDEATSLQEAAIFLRLANKTDLPVTIKVGGCEAKMDIFEAYSLGASKIVAPMIESPYALKKFVDAMKYSLPVELRQSVKKYINIETITACNNFTQMLELPEMDNISGVVIGRVDLINSMGLSRDEINSDKVFMIVEQIALSIKDKREIDFLIGGAVTIEAIPFFQRFPEGVLKAFETRNVIFDISAKDDKSIGKGLAQALHFELEWLKYKQCMYSRLSEVNISRINMLTARYNGIQK